MDEHGKQIAVERRASTSDEVRERDELLVAQRGLRCPRDGCALGGPDLVDRSAPVPSQLKSVTGLGGVEDQKGELRNAEGQRVPVRWGTTVNACDLRSDV